MNIKYLKNKFLITLCIFLLINFISLICFINYSFSQEEITIATYYPSPSGVYQTLRLFPTNPAGYAGTGSACANNGEMFYSIADNQIITCTNNTWQILGGSSSLWALTGNNLYPQQNAYNVVIGGQTAVNKLDVEGAAAIGPSYASTNTAPFNGLIVQGAVGVGTSTPSHTLDVTGQVKIGAYTLPATAGTAGQILVTDGSGHLSWARPVSTSNQGLVCRWFFNGATCSGNGGGTCGSHTDRKVGEVNCGGTYVDFFYSINN